MPVKVRYPRKESLRAPSPYIYIFFCRCSLLFQAFSTVGQIIMSSVRSRVASLVRRAFTARRPLVATISSPFSTHTSSATAATAAGASPASLLGRTARSRQSSSSGNKHILQHQKLHQHLHQQKSGLSTLRRGLTGPLSARLRLPMRGLEEFRDPEIVKVNEHKPTADESG